MRSKKSGFIKLVLIVIAAIFILTYFGVNFRDIVNSPVGQDNVSFLKEVWQKIWTFLVHFWNQYLRDSALWLWNFVKASFGQLRTFTALPK